MPKEFFRVEDVTSINQCASGSNIHIIGVCGVAMAQIAVLLAKQGFHVSGSDKEFYEPMASLLKNSPVKIFTGFSKNNIANNTHLVVIGNAISYGNPEVDVVEERKLPYTCFPKIVEEVLISDKLSIVISGTHGKSTTSAMLASMLYKMKLDPSYFIGGVALDLPLSLHSGSGKFCVLEGDEYDSAFFAKVPKFTFYRPKVCIVSAVEFDHADIYPDLSAINIEFTKLICSMPKDGIAICCLDFDNLKELVVIWKKIASCQIITFGEHAESDVRVYSRKQKGLQQTVKASSSQYGDFNFEIPIPGAYNARNALATLLTARLIGLDVNAAASTLLDFKSVKRRMEVRYEDEKIILIEDFAHHPTAVRETIKAVKESYSEKKLLAIFEPRSNTSRRKVFQQEYIKAFMGADKVILANVEARPADAEEDLLDVNILSQEIARAGTPSVCLKDAAAIEEYVMANLGNNEAIVVMSNGAFGGLVQRLVEKLSTVNK